MLVACRELDADTVNVFPKKIQFPKVTTAYYLQQVATYLLNIVKDP